MNDVLIASSVYCYAEQVWAPTVFSFSNGATAEHSRFHFSTLLQVSPQNVNHEESSCVEDARTENGSLRRRTEWFLRCIRGFLGTPMRE
ncbi:hypothetical protein PM082_010981 [Marasmius tenuissimus]|nr:hypothetical protein PM082_010981 [Marasmius tenuissimus]